MNEQDRVIREMLVLRKEVHDAGNCDPESCLICFNPFQRKVQLDQNENGSTICITCKNDFSPFRYCPNDHRQLGLLP